MFYFTCSPEHKTFLFFTGLNNKDKRTFGMASLPKTVDQHLINSYNTFKQIISCTPVNEFYLTAVLSK